MEPTKLDLLLLPSLDTIHLLIGGHFQRGLSDPFLFAGMSATATLDEVEGLVKEGFGVKAVRNVLMFLELMTSREIKVIDRLQMRKRY